jgi:ribonucleoside-diphosphate reductase alpha chain
LKILDRRGFYSAVSEHVWDTKYRFRDGTSVYDQTIEDTWRRVAQALAAAETRDPGGWAEHFYQQLTGYKFIPAGRILAGAGTGRCVTLFNCFVMGTIEDSMDGIFEALKEGALTMQQGGGIGYDFSTLRPRGTAARRVGMLASGPVSFMHIWDSMCGTVLSSGFRRGAMMATLRCDHPDIEEFIDAKRNPGVLRRFNLSVLVSDDFMQAVASDDDWPLVFPLVAEHKIDGRETLMRHWPGQSAPVACRMHRVIRAKSLWNRLMKAAYDTAEPGVLFIDRVNRLNNLAYCEQIQATNPCGEVPLPPYGACNLGSINLTAFVRAPFTAGAEFDFDNIARTAGIAVRMLDNVIEISHFPLPAQRQQAQATRRIGLGITGLADALTMLGLSYADAAARALAGRAMMTITHAAYRASTELAREKGVFPRFERIPYLNAPFIQSLPDEIRAAITQFGIRNSHLLAIAPAGTISLLAGNVSSGIEPVYGFDFKRTVLNADGSGTEYTLHDYAFALWRAQFGDHPLSPAFVTATDLPPEAHLNMQAEVQRHVDNAISKTINVPENMGFARFGSLYENAFQLGLKGCSVFRPNSITGAVLSPCASDGRESCFGDCGELRQI